jgi:hypothetical protein
VLVDVGLGDPPADGDSDADAPAGTISRARS